MFLPMSEVETEGQQEVLRVSVSRAQRKANRKRQSKRQERSIRRRLDRAAKRANERPDVPVLGGKRMHFDISERVRAHSAGGLGLAQMMVDRLGLCRRIDEAVDLLKIHRPYHESDHVLAIAFNMLAGGTCLDDMERLRQDEALLDNLGACSLPDPTTAGDFCRRFTEKDVESLMDAINETRVEVWSQQSTEFLEEAVIEGDGSIVETTGECKQGMGLSYKGIWGYHPLLISLANTQEPIFLMNREGNRTSAEGATAYYDRAIQLCRKAGFSRILVKGDTAFSQTKHLDRWHGDGVRFIFGYRAKESLEQAAEALPEKAWRKLERPAKYEVATEPRTRPENEKQRIVEERGYKDIRLKAEYVAEFEHRPSRCQNTFRMVVIRKELEVCSGQELLFEENRYLFYITNQRHMKPGEVVRAANKRCAQEKLIGELKSGVRALRAPIDNLVSNWAWMVMSSLAWSLKAWMALLLPVQGRWAARHETDRERILGMSFRGFVESMMRIPVQVIVAARQIRVRLLSWNPMQRIFLRCLDLFERPAPC